MELWGRYVNINGTTSSIATQAATGYTSRGMDKKLDGEIAQATLMASSNKGGMRGIGLIAVLIAEIALKNKATNIAKDYYKLNKKDFDFFKATHQPGIAATVAEAMSPVDNPVYVADFYASAPAGMAKASILDKQWFETRRRTHRYAIGLQRRVDYDFAIQRLHGIVGGWNVGRRYELAYADEHNNRRFDRKLEAGNIGIGIGNIVRQGLASSSAGLASAYDNLGDTVSTIGNGLAANSGYKAGRADTGKRYADRNDVGTNNSRNKDT